MMGQLKRVDNPTVCSTSPFINQSYIDNRSDGHKRALQGQMHRRKNDRSQRPLQRHVYDAARPDDRQLFPVRVFFPSPGSLACSRRWQVALLSRLYHVADLGSLDTDGLGGAGGSEMEIVS